MRMIGCVSPVTDGTLSVLGLDPARDGVQDPRAARRRPQQDTLDMELTVRENIIIYGRYFGLPRKELGAARRRAPRLRRAHRAGQRQGRAALGRDEAPAHDRALARERPRGPPPRRADDGARPAGPARRLGPPLSAEAAGRDAAPDDALHGRGGAAVRPARRHGPRARSSPRARRATSSSATRRARSSSCASTTEAAPRTSSYWTDGLVDRVEPLPDRVLLYTEDGDAASHGLARARPRPESVLVRRSTLEDVFLHLTGRSLIE